MWEHGDWLYDEQHGICTILKFCPSMDSISMLATPMPTMHHDLEQPWTTKECYDDLLTYWFMRLTSTFEDHCQRSFLKPVSTLQTI